MQVQYPPPYQRHVWNYAKANKDTILSALQNVDWHRLFANKTVHQQVNLLNDNIKQKIRGKDSMYKYYKGNGKKTEDYELLTKAVSEVWVLLPIGQTIKCSQYKF